MEIIHLPGDWTKIHSETIKIKMVEDDRVSNVNNSSGKEDDQADKNRIVISNEDTFTKSSVTENKSDHAKIELGKTSVECKQVF